MKETGIPELDLFNDDAPGSGKSLDYSRDYEMMDAFRYALEKTKPEDLCIRLSLVSGGKSKNLLLVNVTDPMAVTYIRDQTIATIAGLLSKKNSRA